MKNKVSELLKDLAEELDAWTHQPRYTYESSDMARCVSCEHLAMLGRPGQPVCRLFWRYIHWERLCTAWVAREGGDLRRPPEFPDMTPPGWVRYPHSVPFRKHEERIH